MAKKLTRKNIIVIIVVAVLVLGGAAFAVVTFLLPKAPAGPVAVQDSPRNAYQPELDKTQDTVGKLLEAGDSSSVQEAQAAVDKQVADANKTQDDDYIVYASLTKANFLMDTNRSQEAIDTILLPLAEKYGNNSRYKGDIYATLSVAYTNLDQPDKAKTYLDQVDGRGGN